MGSASSSALPAGTGLSYRHQGRYFHAMVTAYCLAARCKGLFETKKSLLNLLITNRA